MSDNKDNKDNVKIIKTGRTKSILEELSKIDDILQNKYNETRQELEFLINLMNDSSKNIGLITKTLL